LKAIYMPSGHALCFALMHFRALKRDVSPEVLEARVASHLSLDNMHQQWPQLVQFARDVQLRRTGHFHRAAKHAKPLVAARVEVQQAQVYRRRGIEEVLRVEHLVHSGPQRVVLEGPCHPMPRELERASFRSNGIGFELDVVGISHAWCSQTTPRNELLCGLQ